MFLHVLLKKGWGAGAFHSIASQSALPGISLKQNVPGFRDRNTVTLSHSIPLTWMSDSTGLGIEGK